MLTIRLIGISANNEERERKKKRKVVFFFKGIMCLLLFVFLYERCERRTSADASKRQTVDLRTVKSYTSVAVRQTHTATVYLL